MDREGLAVDNLPLAYYLARKARQRLPRHATTLDDLRQDAALGLLDAARRWDPRAGPFPPYATQRIKGAIWDGVRRWTGGRRQGMARVGLWDEIAATSPEADAIHARLDAERFAAGEPVLRRRFLEEQPLTAAGVGDGRKSLGEYRVAAAIRRVRRRLRETG